MIKSQGLSVTCVLLGTVLAASAGLLPRLLPQEMFWNEEQAKEQSTASSRLHQMTYEAAQAEISTRNSQADKIQAQQQLEAAQARFDQSRAALEKAQFWRRRVPAMLRWAGGGIALVGVVIYLSVKGSQG